MATSPSSSPPSLSSVQPHQAPAGSPPLPEVLGDWQWVYEEVSKGAFEAYRQQHIAVVNRTVLDHDTDQLVLRQRVSGRQGLDPARIVVFYVDG
jgi:hypothetical protein